MDIDDKLVCRLGFSIVGVCPRGQLRSVGYGTPPYWITDSAGAETWAFYTVLSLCASCPRVVTDCLGIVNTLASGRDRATAPMHKLARVWNMVFNILDDHSSVLHALSRVIWMLAHGPTTLL